MSNNELAPQSSHNAIHSDDLNETIIRRGLWFVALIVATGIGIAAFSIASDLLLV